MPLEPTVLDRRAEEGVRILALEVLRQCDGASRQLAGSGMTPSFHELLLGIDRLASVMRSFRPWLAGTIAAKDARALRKLARRARALRETERERAFLSAHREMVDEGARAGFDAMRDRLGASERRLERVLRKYVRVAARLRKRLQHYDVRLGATASSVTLGAALASVFREGMEAVVTRTMEVSGPDDGSSVRRALLATDRLTPLVGCLREQPLLQAGLASDALARLGHVLGDLGAVDRLARGTRRALVEAAGHRARRVHAALYAGDGSAGQVRDALRASPRSNVLKLVAFVRERRDALFAELERSWRAGGLGALAAEVLRVVTALEQRAGGQVAIEVRYLLTRLPERVESVPAAEFVLGWLEGEMVRERIRRVRMAGAERYWRGVFQGEGPHRLQAEEETTSAVFDALWPLTEGRRETRRRREVVDAGVTWFIDELLEQNLVVAETLRPPARDGAPPPGWLSPFIVRELSREPGPVADAVRAEGIHGEVGAPGAMSAPAQVDGPAREPPAP